jgi:hypothetical protein
MSQGKEVCVGEGPEGEGEKGGGERETRQVKKDLAGFSQKVKNVRKK